MSAASRFQLVIFCSTLLGCTESGPSTADSPADDDGPTMGSSTGAPQGTSSGGEVGSSDTGEPEGSSGEVMMVEYTPYEADDPNLQYVGRIDFSDPKRPTFSAAGVYVRARFEGRALAVQLEDEFKWGNNRSFFDVMIDGEFLPKVAPEMGQTRYVITEDLAEGEHDVVIAKRTEASIGRATFLGLEVGGRLLPPPAPPALKIEFIGDSITAGAGVEAANGSAECSEDAIPGAGGGWGQPYNNANRTYAAVAGRLLEADYHLTAASGIGLIRNYSSGFDGRPMPEVYDLLFPEMIAGNTWTMTTWDPALFVPDVVVVALGTNDFSPGDNPPEDPRPDQDVAEYVEAYAAFVTRLRADYPDAEIVAISSPMLGNGWPEADDTFADDLREAVTAVAAQFADAGDTRVHAFFTSQLQGRGCGTHPNVEQHQMLGEELAAELRTILGR